MHGAIRAARLAIACTALLAACSGGDGADASTNGPTTGASVTVVNRSGVAIHEVYVVPTASGGYWGVNRLSSPIYPDQSRTIGSILPGIYDLREVAANGAASEVYGIPLATGETYTWTVTPPPTGLRVENNFAYPITELYVSPASSGNWGSNRLTTPIPAWGSVVVSPIPPGTYDLKAIASDGTTWTSEGFTIVEGQVATWSLYRPWTGTLVVMNESAEAVVDLYVVPYPSGYTYGEWGTDRLGESTIPSRSSLRLQDLPLGDYDLKAVTASGRTWTQYHAPIPQAGSYTWVLYD